MPVPSPPAAESRNVHACLQPVLSPARPGPAIPGESSFPRMHLNSFPRMHLNNGPVENTG